MEESSFGNRAFRYQYESSSRSEGFHGPQGVYSRRCSLLPLTAPSSSSCNIISGSEGSSRLQHQVFPVVEKQESGPEAVMSPETIRLSDIRQGPQSTAGSTGVFTGVDTDDGVAVHSHAPQRNTDKKTKQSAET